MADLQEIPSLDVEIKPQMNSWSTPPAGILLVIEEGPPDFYLLIDDNGNRLLIA
jgi:hypothetical protein